MCSCAFSLNAYDTRDGQPSTTLIFVAILAVRFHARCIAFTIDHRRFCRFFCLDNCLSDMFECHLVVQKLQPKSQVDMVRTTIISVKCVLLNSLAQIIERLHHGKQAHVRQNQIIFITARVKR
ncbi:hypothetical protein NL30_25140 [Burkholderia contaminans]|nr:hypothetical protein NL30_25140 [Burkholderia contaminans]